MQQRFARLIRRTQSVYSVVSLQPIVLYVQLFQDTLAEFPQDFHMLFQATRGRPLYVLCSHGGVAEKLLPGAVQLSRCCAQDYPDVHFYHLCNQQEEVEIWQAHALQAIYCNHNAFVDEAIFHPLEDVRKSFRAVYDARLVPLKRHFLARQVSQLALIYYTVPLIDDLNDVQQIKGQLSTAHYFNHDEQGLYHRLQAPAINHCLNRCSVGLCLSQAEGGMYASIQYLLSGLGVVSTASSGGRDVFFDERFTLTVADRPEAVAAGVDQLLSRQLDPWQIHHSTVRHMLPHRRRFLDLVEKLCGRNFDREWPERFFNRLLRNQSHHQTLAWLREGRFACDAERPP